MKRYKNYENEDKFDHLAFKGLKVAQRNKADKYRQPVYKYESLLDEDLYDYEQQIREVTLS